MVIQYWRDFWLFNA
uniref:Uncharacterized protein n=1 Tax=Rhizophora mucronata TaxID=61149 RepID=A0A2P2QFJ6_RHIMU